MENYCLKNLNFSLLLIMCECEKEGGVSVDDALSFGKSQFCSFHLSIVFFLLFFLGVSRSSDLLFFVIFSLPRWDALKSLTIV